MIELIRANKEKQYITFATVTNNQELENLLKSPHAFIETHTGKTKKIHSSYFVLDDEIDNLTLIIDCLSTMCTVVSVTKINFKQGEVLTSALGT